MTNITAETFIESKNNADEKSAYQIVWMDDIIRAKFGFTTVVSHKDATKITDFALDDKAEAVRLELAARMNDSRASEFKKLVVVSGDKDAIVKLASEEKPEKTRLGNAIIAVATEFQNKAKGKDVKLTKKAIHEKLNKPVTKKTEAAKFEAACKAWAKHTGKNGDLAFEAAKTAIAGVADVDAADEAAEAASVSVAAMVKGMQATEEGKAMMAFLTSLANKK